MSDIRPQVASRTAAATRGLSMRFREMYGLSTLCSARAGFENQHADQWAVRDDRPHRRPCERNTNGERSGDDPWLVPSLIAESPDSVVWPSPGTEREQNAIRINARR
jgi:hypothetical protein